MTPDEYVDLDATAIAEAINTGELTFAAVHAAASAMHERTHADIHAIVEWYDEPSAGAATGPLAGVPFLRKDYGSTEAGRLQEMGSRLTAGHRPSTTSPYFQRLAAAGGRVVGRSAVPEFVMHGTTESAAFGVTRNPHDHSLSAGGSSGGSAAALASVSGTPGLNAMASSLSRMISPEYTRASAWASRSIQATGSRGLSLR